MLVKVQTCTTEVMSTSTEAGSQEGTQSTNAEMSLLRGLKSKLVLLR